MKTLQWGWRTILFFVEILYNYRVYDIIVGNKIVRANLWDVIFCFIIRKGYSITFLIVSTELKKRIIDFPWQNQAVPKLFLRISQTMSCHLFSVWRIKNLGSYRPQGNELRGAKSTTRWSDEFKTIFFSSGKLLLRESDAKNKFPSGGEFLSFSNGTRNRCDPYNCVEIKMNKRILSINTIRFEQVKCTSWLLHTSPNRNTQRFVIRLNQKCYTNDWTKSVLIFYFFKLLFMGFSFNR